MEQISLFGLQIVSEASENHCAIYEDSENHEKYDSNIDKVSSKNFYYYDDCQIQDFFIKQVYIGSIIKNPAVLPISAFDIQNSRIYTKHMVNGSLSSSPLSSPGPNLSIGTMKYIILIGISQGMKYLHSHGIIHLGLAPCYIYLDENYYPHISGFMFSHTNNNIPLSSFEVPDFEIHSQKSMMTTMIGPEVLHYQAAPELVDGKATYKVDVYSFALIAYELITNNKIRGKKFHEFTSDNRPDLECINDKVIKDLISHMWDQNPIYRPNFDEITNEILKDNFLNGVGAGKAKGVVDLGCFRQ